MKRFIYLIFFVIALDSIGFTQDQRIAKEDLQQLKYNLLKLQYVSMARIYLQTYNLNEEKEEAIDYINKEAPLVYEYLKLNYSDYVFDSLSNINKKYVSVHYLRKLSDGEVGFLSELEKLEQEVLGATLATEEIYKSLVTFNDYEDPIKKFMASEAFEREILHQMENVMIVLDEIKPEMLNGPTKKLFSARYLKVVPPSGGPASLQQTGLQLAKRIISVSDSLKSARKLMEVELATEDFLRLQTDLGFYLEDLIDLDFYLNDLRKIKRLRRETFINFDEYLKSTSDSVIDSVLVKFQQNYDWYQDNLDDRVKELQDFKQKYNTKDLQNDPLFMSMDIFFSHSTDFYVREITEYIKLINLYLQSLPEQEYQE